jgi:hypothetical protein
MPTLAIAAACSGSTTSAGSCAFNDPTPGYTVCEDFLGSGFSPAIAQDDCTQGGGVYSKGACPTEGVLGTCEVASGTSAAGRITYYATDAGTSTANEQANCTSAGGIWTAG